MKHLLPLLLLSLLPGLAPAQEDEDSRLQIWKRFIQETYGGRTTDSLVFRRDIPNPYYFDFKFLRTDSSIVPFVQKVGKTEYRTTRFEATKTYSKTRISYQGRAPMFPGDVVTAIHETLPDVSVRMAMTLCTKEPKSDDTYVQQTWYLNWEFQADPSFGGKLGNSDRRSPLGVWQADISAAGPWVLRNVDRGFAAPSGIPEDLFDGEREAEGTGGGIVSGWTPVAGGMVQTGFARGAYFRPVYMQVSFPGWIDSWVSAGGTFDAGPCVENHRQTWSMTLGTTR